jgi:putative selenium metabolism protein SsnA
MSERVELLYNAQLLQDWQADSVIEDGAVVWQGSRILDCGPSQALLDAYPDAERQNLGGRLLTPGLVNAHHHVYSALAAGFNPAAEMNSFLDTLRQLWWRLDRALDPASIKLSAQLTAVRAIRSGCTCLFDHHASPACITGSLDLIGEVLTAAGISAVLCYEASSRNAPEEALIGLEESLRFATEHASDHELRGLIGLHAPFTLSNEELGWLAKHRKGHGIHIHVAEDRLDMSHSQENYGKSPIERLDEFELLDERSLLAHGIHLEHCDLEKIASRKSWLVINPESNANNQVGFPNLKAMNSAGLKLALGTDGMSSNMITSLRSAFLLARANSSDAGAGWDSLAGLLAANAELAALHFGDVSRGRLVAGARADLVVWNHVSGLSLDRNGLLGNLIFGLAQSEARDTLAAGRWLMRMGRLLTIDEEKLGRDLGKIKPELENRFNNTAAAGHPRRS